MGSRHQVSAAQSRRHAQDQPGAYLDASAAVKLIVAEQESDALLSFLAHWPLHLASAEQAASLIGCLISYDAEQAAAASMLGWQVAAPAA